MSDKESNPKTYTVTDLYEAATYAVYSVGPGSSREEIAQALAERLGLTLRHEMPERVVWDNTCIRDAETGFILLDMSLEYVRDVAHDNAVYAPEFVRCYNAIRQVQRYAKRREGDNIRASDYYSLLSLISAR